MGNDLAANPDAGQGETLEALETRLRAAHDERQRNAGIEADRPANERLVQDVLRQRSIREIEPDTTPNADGPLPIRLDGSAWTPADHRLCEEMQKYVHVDILGARIPPGYRR